MAGVGTLIKQARKMQDKISGLQASLEARVIDVSHGGGAVKIKINGAGGFLDIALAPEFLKEDPKFVSETLLAAVREAADTAKKLHEDEMQKATAGFQLPGLF
ncbi:MAG: YbaB/EbfC family nucleoid-associated protein [Opitutaceae bacterium]|jgi:DNA-binding YbaB/EbfC family protein|nr:YbaB/EbfC family nucleoid-associated protein [Opitutaceae bacterium]